MSLIEFLKGRLQMTPEVVAYTGEPLTAVVYRMAETGHLSLPVLDLASGADVVGVISLTDLLAARRRILDHDGRRERLLRFSLRPRRSLGRWRVKDN